MRGRKPTPTPLKILRGNPSRRPVGATEPRPRNATPACPAWLSTQARAEWRRIVPELQAVGLLTLCDRAALAGYCQAWAELVIATKILEAEGRVIDEPIFAEGEQIGSRKKKHPALSMQRDAFARVRSFASEFGLTPASRPRLQAAPVKGAGDDDPLLKILNA